MPDQGAAKISCIIPVYNEAQRVSAVIDAALQCPEVEEVIVVNDGSTDNTEAVLAAKAGIKLISYRPNQGKTRALKAGFLAAKNNLVMMIDSDLVGLDRAALQALIQPVVSGRADIAISLRSNALLIYKLLGLDFVSGERVFDKKILGDLNQLDRLPKFGFESYFNKIIVKNKLRLAVVRWPKVLSPRKSAKQGFWAGRIGDLKMTGQIIEVLTLRGLLSQIFSLRRLRV